MAALLPSGLLQAPQPYIGHILKLEVDGRSAVRDIDIAKPLDFTVGKVVGILNDPEQVVVDFDAGRTVSLSSKKLSNANRRILPGAKADFKVVCEVAIYQFDQTSQRYTVRTLEWKNSSKLRVS